MKVTKFLEFVEKDFDAVKSFHIKDELNTKIWEEDKSMKEDVREKLLTISQDFYNTTSLNVEIDDITLTGSLANFNWSEKYSDFDLHIIIDFEKVNSDTKLVKKFTDSAKNLWNKSYDLYVNGFEVEVYIQDIKEPHRSSGVYSVLNSKWNIEPVKVDFIPDEMDIKEKAKGIMMLVDDLEDEIDKYDYNEYKKRVKKLWDKIKNYRKSGLESESGEYSLKNLVFKLLRRNGYIERILDLRKESYEKQF
jgi:hypothetical protein